MHTFVLFIHLGEKLLDHSTGAPPHGQIQSTADKIYFEKKSCRKFQKEKLGFDTCQQLFT